MAEPRPDLERWELGVSSCQGCRAGLSVGEFRGAREPDPALLSPRGAPSADAASGPLSQPPREKYPGKLLFSVGGGRAHCRGWGAVLTERVKKKDVVY